MPKSRTGLSAADLADQFALRTTHTPALPSQREAMRGALQLLAGIAVRMEPAEDLKRSGVSPSKPPHDLTGSAPQSVNAPAMTQIQGEPAQ